MLSAQPEASAAVTRQERERRAHSAVSLRAGTYPVSLPDAALAAPITSSPLPASLTGCLTLFVSLPLQTDIYFFALTFCGVKCARRESL